MLSAMRRHAYSWMIRAVLFLIILVFAFWGIGTGLFNQVRPIASVDGQTILADEVDREATQIRRNLQQLYGPNASEALKNINLRQEALQQIVENRLIQREARRLGLEISDAELQRQIATNRAFQIDGQFDFQTYQAVLRDNDLAPADFERSQRDSIVAGLLKQMVSQGVLVSDDEARLEFNRRNAKLALAYVEIPYTQFAARITPTESQIADYYKNNGEKFREPEQVKVVFVDYDPAVLADKLNPSEKEIEEYYDKNKITVFTHAEQAHARHILTSVAPGATDKEKAEAKAKAEDVLRQVKAQGDFTKLAAKYSDDPGNKFKGGDLGFFGRGQMVKPFEDAAFKLKPGEVALVETEFGYHVVKVDEVKPGHVDTPKEARPKIIEALKRKAGDAIAHKALHEDLAAALESHSLKELAEKRGLGAIETPFFAADEPVKGAEKNPQLVRAAFKLDEGDIRAVTGPGADSFLVKLLKRRPAQIPPLKEIEAKVREALVRDQAEQASRDFAQSVLKQIKTADDLTKVAAANKLQVHDTDEFSRADGAVPPIGKFPEVTDSASLVAKVPGVIGRVMEHGGSYYIFELLSRKPPRDEEWKTAGSSFTERLVQARREQVWNRFVNGLKEQAKITIDANQLGQTATESSM